MPALLHGGVRTRSHHRLLMPVRRARCLPFCLVHAVLHQQPDKAPPRGWFLISGFEGRLQHAQQGERDALTFSAYLEAELRRQVPVHLHERVTHTAAARCVNTAQVCAADRCGMSERLAPTCPCHLTKGATRKEVPYAAAAHGSPRGDSSAGQVVAVGQGDGELDEGNRYSPSKQRELPTLAT